MKKTQTYCLFRKTIRLNVFIVRNGQRIPMRILRARIKICFRPVYAILFSKSKIQQSAIWRQTPNIYLPEMQSSEIRGLDAFIFASVVLTGFLRQIFVSFLEIGRTRCTRHAFPRYPFAPVLS